MANKPADVIERLQRLRKIMTEEINLEKQVCKIKSKRDLDTNVTLNRLSPIPQEQVSQTLKKSSRNTVSKSRNEPKYNYPQKTAPIRKKKSPDLRKSSTQRLSSKEKTTVQTITEYRGSRSKSQTRSKHTSQNRKMRNVEVQTGVDRISSERNYRETLSHSTESEKRISAMHQDRLKRYFFGIWLRQRLRAARQNMDDSLRKRGTTTYHDNQNYTQTRHRIKQEQDHNKYYRRHDEYIEYDNNENINNNPKATIRRKSASRKSEKSRNSSSQRKNSVSSSIRTRKYQTEYIIETDKCKTKVRRQPTNVLESEITRILEAKKQHIRVPSPIRSRTTISTTKTVKRSRRKPRKTGSDVPEKQHMVTVSTNTTSRKHRKDIISDDEYYDDPEVDNYIQKIRQQKLLEKFEEQRQKQMKTNVNSQYGYIPKSDENERASPKPKIPSRTQYNDIIDQIEEEQKNQIHINFYNNDSNSSSNSIKNIEGVSENLSNIQKLQGQNHKSEDASSDILNLSFPDEKHGTEINSFDVNDLGAKKNGKNKLVADMQDGDMNLVPPEVLHPKKPTTNSSSNQMIATVTDSPEQRKKEQQKIKAQIEKMKQENYLFSSDDSDTEEIENKRKLNVTNQQNQYSTTKTTTTTTISTTKIIKDEEKEMQNSEINVKKTQQNILDKMFNTDDLFSSENIENMINDEFSSELAKGTNRFSSQSSSIITTDKYRSNKPLFKPENQKKVLYVKTSKHILYENIEEEEEEDSGIDKYLSDEYREIPAKSGNNEEDKIDYSDIEINNEKLKKIGSSNIIEDLSLNEEITKTTEKKESSQVVNIKVSTENIDIIIEEEEEEELEIKVDNQTLPSKPLDEKPKEDEKKKPVAAENELSDDEKFLSSDVDLKLIEEEEELEEEKEKKTESNLMKEQLNKSSDEINDLLFEHSSDFEQANKQPSKENESYVDDFNESNENEINKSKVQKSENSISIDDFENENEADQEDKNKEQKSDDDIDIDIDDFENKEDNVEKSKTQKSDDDIDIDVDDFENQEEHEDKSKTQKSDDDIDIDVDDFENQEKQEDKNKEQKSDDDIDIDVDVDDFENQEKHEDKNKEQKSDDDIDIDIDDFENEKETTTEVAKSGFPFKTDFEVAVDDLSSDNLEEKQELKYELLPPTTLTEALGLSNETENQNTIESTKSKSQSEDDFISDVIEESKDEKDKTKSEEKENEENLSDVDIEIDDFNDDSANDETNKKEEKKEKEPESGSDVDVFVDDFNEDDENNKSKEKENETKQQKSDSDIDIDLDDILDENDAENKEEKQQEDKNKNQAQKSDSGLDIEIDDFEDETEKSRFPFKTDFEIAVDDLSSDNLEEKPKLEYELLPPTTLTEALGLSNETAEKVETHVVTTTTTTTTKTTKNDSVENIDDISISLSDQEKEKTKEKEESDIDIEIDDFQMSDDDNGNNNTKKSNSDPNIDDISIHSEQEEQNKADSDTNIDDISIESDKEEQKKEDSDFIIDDFEMPSEGNDEATNNKTPSSNNNNNEKNDFPFKTDYVVKVDDLSSNGIEERPKLDIFTLQNQQQKQQKQVTIDSHSDHELSDKEIDIEIEGDFEIMSDDEKEQKKQNVPSNSNQVLANNSSRLNQGIDNIAEDFFIESGSDIDIKDFQDNENEKAKEEEDKNEPSDAIDVVLDDISEDENKNQQNQDNNDDDIILSDFEIDIGD